MNIKPVILAGGSGLRLWPLSRQKLPKQFIKIFSGKSLLQLTIERHNRKGFDVPVIITSEEHRFIVAEQIRELNLRLTIIIEPISKNTAPCVITAALQNINYEGSLLIVPVDHVINNNILYYQTIKDAASVTNKGFIVTLGIKPSNAHTGYGYIKKGKNITDKAFEVTHFKEKPDIATATQYLKEETYFWNSGIFIFKPKALIIEAKKIENSMFELVQAALSEATIDSDFIKLDTKTYSQIEANSIDYSIIEKTNKLVMVEAKFEWNDVGNFDSLWKFSKKDKNDNVVRGRVILEEVKGSYIDTDSKVIAILGMKDIIVVNNKDVVLIADKTRSEEVKHLVCKLKAQAPDLV